MALPQTAPAGNAYPRQDSANGDDEIEWPTQAVYVDPHGNNAIGPNATFRTDLLALYNPTNTTPPFFQVFHSDFVTKVLGKDARVARIAHNPDFAFAHEAPIYLPATDELTFASNAGGVLGFNGWDVNNQVAKISMAEAETKMKAVGPGVAVDVTVTKLDLPESVQMTNGGTGPYDGELLIVNSGRANLPPTVAIVNPAPPHNTRILLDNFFGRQFNSINDVKIHPTSGAIFFTDPPYGWLNHFRPKPLLPSHVYRFDPLKGDVRVVADGIEKPNGIAFSTDGKVAYITDTGAAQGVLGIEQTAPSTIYAFDINEGSQAFSNRRIFAYIDTGVPDGLQVDPDGNVYSGCGDGVHVWDSTGRLIGKIFVGVTCPNFTFAGTGRLAILADTAIYIVHLAAAGPSLAYSP